jgi:hypothetical protein
MDPQAVDVAVAGERARRAAVTSEQQRLIALEIAGTDLGLATDDWAGAQQASEALVDLLTQDAAAVLALPRQVLEALEAPTPADIALELELRTNADSASAELAAQARSRRGAIGRSTRWVEALELDARAQSLAVAEVARRASTHPALQATFEAQPDHLRDELERRNSFRALHPEFARQLEVAPPWAAQAPSAALAAEEEKWRLKAVMAERTAAAEHAAAAQAATEQARRVAAAEQAAASRHAERAAADRAEKEREAERERVAAERKEAVTALAASVAEEDLRRSEHDREIGALYTRMRANANAMHYSAAHLDQMAYNDIVQIEKTRRAAIDPAVQHACDSTDLMSTLGPAPSGPAPRATPPSLASLPSSRLVTGGETAEPADALAAAAHEQASFEALTRTQSFLKATKLAAAAAALRERQAVAERVAAERTSLTASLEALQRTVRAQAALAVASDLLGASVASVFVQLNTVEALTVDELIANGLPHCNDLKSMLRQSIASLEHTGADPVQLACLKETASFLEAKSGKQRRTPVNSRYDLPKPLASLAHQDQHMRVIQLQTMSQARHPSPSDARTVASAPPGTFPGSLAFNGGSPLVASYTDQHGVCHSGASSWGIIATSNPNEVAKVYSQGWDSNTPVYLVLRRDWCGIAQGWPYAKTLFEGQSGVIQKKYARPIAALYALIQHLHGNTLPIRLATTIFRALGVPKPLWTQDVSSFSKFAETAEARGGFAKGGTGSKTYRGYGGDNSGSNNRGSSTSSNSGGGGGGVGSGGGGSCGGGGGSGGGYGHGTSPSHNSAMPLGLGWGSPPTPPLPPFFDSRNSGAFAWPTLLETNASAIAATEVLPPDYVSDSEAAAAAGAAPAINANSVPADPASSRLRRGQESSSQDLADYYGNYSRPDPAATGLAAAALVGNEGASASAATGAAPPGHVVDGEAVPATDAAMAVTFLAAETGPAAAALAGNEGASASAATGAAPPGHEVDGEAVSATGAAPPASFLAATAARAAAAHTDNEDASASAVTGAPPPGHVTDGVTVSADGTPSMGSFLAAATGPAAAALVGNECALASAAARASPLSHVTDGAAVSADGTPPVGSFLAAVMGPSAAVRVGSERALASAAAVAAPPGHVTDGVTVSSAGTPPVGSFLAAATGPAATALAGNERASVSASIMPGQVYGSGKVSAAGAALAGSFLAAAAAPVAAALTGNVDAPANAATGAPSLDHTADGEAASATNAALADSFLATATGSVAAAPAGNELGKASAAIGAKLPGHVTGGGAVYATGTALACNSLAAATGTAAAALAGNEGASVSVAAGVATPGHVTGGEAVSATSGTLASNFLAAATRPAAATLAGNERDSTNASAEAAPPGHVAAGEAASAADATLPTSLLAAMMGPAAAVLAGIKPAKASAVTGAAPPGHLTDGEVASATGAALANSFSAATAATLAGNEDASVNAATGALLSSQVATNAPAAALTMTRAMATASTAAVTHSAAGPAPRRADRFKQHK